MNDYKLINTPIGKQLTFHYKTESEYQATIKGLESLFSFDESKAILIKGITNQIILPVVEKRSDPLSVGLDMGKIQIVPIGFGGK